MDKLDLEKNIKNKLLSININSIDDLKQLQRQDLKENGFTNDEISTIAIQLQLLGYDLKKSYKKKS